MNINKKINYDFGGLQRSPVFFNPIVIRQAAICILESVTFTQKPRSRRHFSPRVAPLVADLVGRLLHAVKACVLRSKGIDYTTQRDICPGVKTTHPPPNSVTPSTQQYQLEGKLQRPELSVYYIYLSCISNFFSPL